MPDENDWTHRYHAEATVLEGHLRLPFVQPIEPQARAKVPEIGGYLSQRANGFRVEGIVSYNSAHTQVYGHQEEKHGGGYITLSTSVVEGLNILNVVTADRVVAQVSTEHPLDGLVPHVTFLGTQFHNLRIAGHPIEVDLDLDMVGPKPEGDRIYTRHSGFMERVAGQLGFLRKHDELPKDVRERYALDLQESDGSECTEFSLVKKIEGSFPGKVFGHVLDIPNFGKVHLATVRVVHSDPEGGKNVEKETLIELTMVDAQMGCIASGQVMAGTTKTNGNSLPPTG